LAQGNLCFVDSSYQFTAGESVKTKSPQFYIDGGWMPPKIGDTFTGSAYLNF